MSIKLKALGLGLLAAMALGAFAVVNASATVSGHFAGEEEHTIVKGEESGESHRLKFHGESGSPIECTDATYEGTVATKTTTVVQVTPTYGRCRTGNDSAGSHPITVDMNGCSYTFFSNSTTHGTVAIDCPEGKVIEITHPNCTITVPAQAPGGVGSTITGGITYSTEGSGKTHALTATVTLDQITGHYHGGICVFLGTPHKFEMTGSVTVKGTNTEGTQIGITHT